jgi:hypothetical protein
MSSLLGELRENPSISRRRGWGGDRTDNTGYPTFSFFLLPSPPFLFLSLSRSPTMGYPDTFRGYAVHSSDKWADFKVIEYKPRPFTDYDVDIKISHCGVCGSDVHTIRDQGVSCSPSLFCFPPLLAYLHLFSRRGEAHSIPSSSDTRLSAVQCASARRSPTSRRATSSASVPRSAAVASASSARTTTRVSITSRRRFLFSLSFFAYVRGDMERLLHGQDDRHVRLHLGRRHVPARWIRRLHPIPHPIRLQDSRVYPSTLIHSSSEKEKEKRRTDDDDLTYRTASLPKSPLPCSAAVSRASPP